jgi:NAD(P)H-hydrate epimerase
VAVAEVAATVRLNADYCAGLVPRRDPDAHKYDFGRVVTVTGSLEFAGAAYLAALGAARAGAGLVAMAVPVSLRPVFAGRLPEAILVALPETDDGRIDVSQAIDALGEREPDALVLGPGLHETPDYTELVLRLLATGGPPTTVDAGALNMLAQSGEWWKSVSRKIVLTPHAGEFERLTGTQIGAADDDRARRAVEASERFRAVVVLKGARTVIAAPDGRLAVAPFANPSLATAGSGDVLSGVIGALVAQKLDAFDAACLGVFLHGTAGEAMSERLGDAGLIASDLPYEIAIARAGLARRRG